MPEGYVDHLMALAEIASVFVGFVALVSVLARDRLGMVRVIAVVVTAAIVLLGALMPVVLGAYGIDDTLCLQISAIAALMVNFTGLVVQLRYVTHFVEAHREGRSISTAIWAIEVPFWITMIACAFGRTGYEAGLYLTGLVLAMFQVIILLMAVVVDLERSWETTAGDSE